MKTRTSKKLTKRQRKAVRGPNAAVSRSRQHGELHIAAGTAYRGNPPQYVAIETAPGIRTFKKVVLGIPFVCA